MSFRFKTAAGMRASITAMEPSTDSRCPMHAIDVRSAAPLSGLDPWPPGPRTRITGWSLLRRMSADLMGALGQWKREFGDVVHLRMWPEHQVVLTDPELVRQLLVAQHDRLVRWERGREVMGKLHGHSVLMAEGAAWRDKRQALQPAMSPKVVQAAVPRMAEAARRALDGWPARNEHWPIEQAFNALAMDIIMQQVFSTTIEGDACAADQAVREVSAAADREFYWPASWPDAAPWKWRKRRAMATLRRLIERQVQARVAVPDAERPDDLLTRLLALHAARPQAWTLQDVRDECMTAFLAGHETTAGTLTWWAWCMAANPQAQRQAALEVDAQLQGRLPGSVDLAALGYLTQTVQETMRLYPAAPVLLSRRGVQPIELGPWHLPARTLFAVPVWLMHLDERWFPQPQVFRPERFAPDAAPIPRGAYLPFGVGPRVCLGQHLAMAEILTVAALLLQRFELAPAPLQAAPRPKLAVTLRPQAPLSLALVPR
jgi:unspecific monooxygenase